MCKTIIGPVGHFNGGQPRPSTTLVRLGHSAAVLGVPIGPLDVIGFVGAGINIILMFIIITIMSMSMSIMKLV
jgi:hypothetical protein